LELHNIRNDEIITKVIIVRGVLLMSLNQFYVERCRPLLEHFPAGNAALALPELANLP